MSDHFYFSPAVTVRRHGRRLPPVATMRRHGSVKAISCIIRNFHGYQDLYTITGLKETNTCPRHGDLIFVKCGSDEGFCNTIYAETGVTMQLYEGDIFVGVLAARHSDGKGHADLSYGVINKGDTLHYIEPGGMVGAGHFVSDWTGNAAMPLEVLGFARNHHGGVANVADDPLIDPVKWRGPIVAGRLLLVAGPSPECGKTILISQYGRALKRLFPGTRIAAIKAAGSGSIADKQAFLDAGFDLATDFCDAGLASTYDVPADRFIAVYEAMINYCEKQSDVVIVELGSNMTDRSVLEALTRASRHKFPCTLVVDDDPGTMKAIRLLAELDIPVLAVNSVKEDSCVLAMRINRPNLKFIDARNKTHMNLAATEFYGFQRTI